LAAAAGFNHPDHGVVVPYGGGSGGGDDVRRDPNWLCVGRRTLEDLARYIAVIASTNTVVHSEAGIMECFHRWSKAVITSKPYFFPPKKTGENALRKIFKKAPDGSRTDELPAWLPQQNKTKPDRCEPGIQFRGKSILINYALIDPANQYDQLLESIIRDSGYKHTIPRRLLLGCEHEVYPWIYPATYIAAQPNKDLVSNNPHFVSDHTMITLTGRRRRSDMNELEGAMLHRYPTDVDTHCLLMFFRGPRYAGMTFNQKMEYHPVRVQEKLNEYFIRLIEDNVAPGEDETKFLCFYKYPDTAIARCAAHEKIVKEIDDPDKLRENEQHVEDALKTVGIPMDNAELVNNAKAMLNANAAHERLQLTSAIMDVDTDCRIAPDNDDSAGPSSGPKRLKMTEHNDDLDGISRHMRAALTRVGRPDDAPLPRRVLDEDDYAGDALRMAQEEGLDDDARKLQHIMKATAVADARQAAAAAARRRLDPVQDPMEEDNAFDDDGNDDDDDGAGVNPLGAIFRTEGVPANMPNIAELVNNNSNSDDDDSET
jgi:hypothetical protein